MTQKATVGQRTPENEHGDTTGPTIVSGTLTDLEMGEDPNADGPTSIDSVRSIGGDVI